MSAPGLAGLLTRSAVMVSLYGPTVPGMWELAEAAASFERQVLNEGASDGNADADR